MSSTLMNLKHSLATLILGCMLCAGSAMAVNPPNDPPDLGATPPDLSASVDPNFVFTFDDSGSMASTYMGDFRPYDNGSWSGPWNCANVIDPRATLTSDPKTKGMNGVFYNPNIKYTPPLKEDGTPFPDADATLKAVWEDGTSVNRPVSPLTGGATGFNDNPMGSSTGTSALTNLTGGYLKQVGSTATCTGQPGSCSCTGSGSTKVCTTDNRWQCGNSSSWNPGRPTSNPFDGTFTDPDSGGKPIGGPVYWRLKNTVTFTAGTDIGTLGQFTAAGLTKLYTAANWEAVSVPAAQYQNFANWYAYYRYRNSMARTAISRVFGVIGTPNSANIRVTWQNLNNSTYLLPASTIITSLDDNSTDPTTAKPYRQAFFNWIYQIPAANSTPSRSAEIRAGDFFKRPNSSDLKDPYWQPGSGGQPGLELACRQNFHLLMTDGLYNQPAVSVSGNASNTNAGSTLGPAPPTAPPADPTAYTTASGANPTTIFNHTWAKDSDTGSSYSDIAFYYWANNLRPDLKTTYPNDAVPPYYPDQTTGVAGPAAVVDPTDPGATPEVFWNPNNDPATWPHVVQFAVTLGAFGNLTFSDDLDCNQNEGFGTGNDDACKLRTGQTTSSGSVGWPQPNGTGSGIAANIDDLWHAALNSRGAFFVATNPSELVQHITDIITNILARAQTSTSNAVSSNISSQTNSTFSYPGGYDSGSWSGFLYQYLLAQDGSAIQANWDAGCIMTGGTFTPIAPSTTQPPRGSCKVSSPPPTPPARKIFTSVRGATGLAGRPFQWGSLGAAEQTALNYDPNTTDPNLITGQVATGTSDGNGTDRVDYLRGKRDNESAPTAEATPRQFRVRKSVLGPIVNSASIYEAGPESGITDTFPAGSPEELAARPCLGAAGNASPGCGSYEKFLQDNANRTPVIYVGANDGMVHAFDAKTGVEQWAYVPNMLYGNGQLLQVTNPKSTLITTVDDSPIHADIFYGGAWHTIMVGAMRLGARGIYALDITDQTPPSSEAAAAGKFMWEFSNINDADLGYTYASTNTARLSNGKWVVLLASGYYPQKLQVRSATYGVNQAPDNAPGATANITHLFVLDAQSGTLIRKIDTPTGITSYGLSTPGVVTLDGDEIDELAVAGDLAGNLWRFDLSDPNPGNWTVDNMFRTYTATTPCSATNTSGVGCEPITVQPIAFVDTLGVGQAIYVFGSGEYLGPTDRTSSSVLGTNHFFGVRDFGTASAKYPLHESDLVSQTLTQNAAGKRFLASSAIPSTAGGWMIPLNVTGVLGERDVATVFPLFSEGVAILTSLIPGANNDPCTPGRFGAIMAVDASTGGPVGSSASGSGGAVQVGSEVLNPPSTGGINVLARVGGGYYIPGIGVIGSSNAGNGSVALNFGTIWRRTSWRELLNDL